MKKKTTINSRGFSKCLVSMLLFLLLETVAVTMWLAKEYLCLITVILKPMSYFSLLRVHCDEEKCIHCGKCLQVCPAKGMRGIICRNDAFPGYQLRGCKNLNGL